VTPDATLCRFDDIESSPVIEFGMGSCFHPFLLRFTVAQSSERVKKWAGSHRRHETGFDQE
jgi:hypothetical protein